MFSLVGAFSSARATSSAAFAAASMPSKWRAYVVWSICTLWPILVRRRLITTPTANTPLELRTSYIPDLPETSPLAQPALLPGTWPQILAAHIHIPHTHARQALDQTVTSGPAAPPFSPKNTPLPNATGYSGETPGTSPPDGVSINL